MPIMMRTDCGLCDKQKQCGQIEGHGWICTDCIELLPPTSAPAIAAFRKAEEQGYAPRQPRPTTTRIGRKTWSRK